MWWRRLQEVPTASSLRWCQTACLYRCQLCQTVFIPVSYTHLDVYKRQLHIWLPKAHPVAPAPASALLSGILTKAGVFGIVVVSCVMFGTDGNWGLLVAVLGFITMFLGALLALFSVNLKRTLACSSVSQIGFILTWIGMFCLLKSAGQGNGLAVRGTFLHCLLYTSSKPLP